MAYTLESARKYLQWYNQRGISGVIARDCFWLKENYLPAVACLEKANFKKDKFLLGWSYYMIGDVHDFTHCPKAAIKAYRKSFEFDPLNAPAMREIGGCYYYMGQNKKAATVLKKALQIDPDDKYAAVDYQIAIEDPCEALYKKGDICWQAREFIAQDKPESAIKLLKGKRSIEAYKTMSRAHSVLEQGSEAVEQWQKIAKLTSKIEMTYADWFYMTDTVWNSVDFWQAITVCSKQNRFKYSMWPENSITDHIVDNVVNRKFYSKADLKRCNKNYFLIAQYHIARISKDVKLISKLLKQYPNWKEVRKLHNKLC